MPAPRVFVSHSHQDNEFGFKFVADLRRALGGDEDTVWYDARGGLHGGDLWWRKIMMEITSRPVYIVVLSPAAVESAWVNTEIDLAWRQKHSQEGKLIIPILLRHCEVRPDLSLVQIVNFAAPRPYGEAFAELLLALGLELQGQPQTTIVPIVPSDRLPQRFADLGFVPHKARDVECILPPLCEVAAGSFLMGSDPRHDNQALDGESPRHNVNLPTFSIARFPVTVAEYACFLRSGYRHPVDWSAQLGKQDHPVVRVSWFGANAYAAWLARLTGKPWRLPTEAEWEKAARGIYGFIYPWGSYFDVSRCNTSKSGIGSTTPIGAYPAGASPFGAQDLAGNVLEWTSSLFKPYPYNLDDGREQPDSTENRVLRGGSWRVDPAGARAGRRYRSLRPNMHFDHVGFRLVWEELAPA